MNLGVTAVQPIKGLIAAKAFKKPKMKQPMIFTENVPKGKFKRIGLSNLDNPKRETPPSALPIAMPAIWVSMLFSEIFYGKNQGGITRNRTSATATITKFRPICTNPNFSSFV